MILLDDLERGGVRDFGVFCYFDSGDPLRAELAIVGIGTHGFSPSSRTYNSKRFGAFIIALNYVVPTTYPECGRSVTEGKSGQRTALEMEVWRKVANSNSVKLAI